METNIVAPVNSNLSLAPELCYIREGMPRKNPISAREVEICRRVCEFRKRTGLSRIAFAQKAGIDSSVLVRYEHARVPLRYAHAWRFMRIWFLSPSWLATGQGGFWTRSAGLAPSPESISSSANELFTSVYDRLLSMSQSKGTAKDSLPSGDELRARYLWSLGNKLQDWLSQMPDSCIASFGEQLRRTAQQLFETFPKDSAAIVAQRKERLSRGLDFDTPLRLYGTDGGSLVDNIKAGNISGPAIASLTPEGIDALIGPKPKKKQSKLSAKK